jgi:hypothetical protein
MSELRSGCVPDVMQVCHHGHVITDLLHTYPERSQSHCPRCGAPTQDSCLTCGRPIAGAVPVPGLVPVGQLAPPPYCSTCGAAFPWTKRAAAAASGPLSVLESLLRRMPRVIRQLRVRQGDRPPLRVEDERDLEDLLRALLPLHFDDVRLESRTPTYASRTRMDCLLVSAESGRLLAVPAKRATTEVRERQLQEQLQEDRAYYERQPHCWALVGLVYDPEGLLCDPRALETAWSASDGKLERRCVIAS